MSDGKRWIHNTYEMDALPDNSVVVIGIGERLDPQPGESIGAPAEFAVQKLVGDWYMAGMPRPVPLSGLDWHAFPALVVFTLADGD